MMKNLEIERVTPSSHNGYNDYSIIDVKNESYIINATTLMMGHRGGVPFWSKRYIYSYWEIKSATNEQKHFYMVFKSKFSLGKYLDLEGNNNYAFVFKTEENYKVVNAGNKIGEMPMSPQIIEDNNIWLAAKIWKIKFVDHKAKKIEVVPARDGKKPKFSGSSGPVHRRIRQKMFEILYSSSGYDVLDQASSEEIRRLRNDFSVFHIQNLNHDRPLLVNDKSLDLFTFTGTRINRTLEMLFDAAGILYTLDESSSRFVFKVSKDVLVAKVGLLPDIIRNINSHIAESLVTNPGLLEFSKWGKYLPLKYQVKLLRDRYFDVEQTEKSLAAINIIENKSLNMFCHPDPP